MLAAKIHDAPNDEEIAGKAELLDEIELARDLRAGAIVVWAVSIACADIGDFAEKRRLGLVRRHRIIRKPVAEIRHRVLQAIG